MRSSPTGSLLIRTRTSPKESSFCILCFITRGNLKEIKRLLTSWRRITNISLTYHIGRLRKRPSKEKDLWFSITETRKSIAVCQNVQIKKYLMTCSNSGINYQLRNTELLPSRAKIGKGRLFIIPIACWPYYMIMQSFASLQSRTNRSERDSH